MKYLFADGSQESVFTSGIIQRVSPNSDVTIEHPNGQLEIHTTQFKVEDFLITVVPLRWVVGIVRVLLEEGIP